MQTALAQGQQADDCFSVYKAAYDSAYETYFEADRAADKAFFAALQANRGDTPAEINAATNAAGQELKNAVDASIRERDAALTNAGNNLMACSEGRDQSQHSESANFCEIYSGDKFLACLDDIPKYEVDPANVTFGEGTKLGDLADPCDYIPCISNLNHPTQEEAKRSLQQFQEGMDKGINNPAYSLSFSICHVLDLGDCARDAELTDPWWAIFKGINKIQESKKFYPK